MIFCTSAAQNAAFQSVMEADSFSTMSIPDGCNVTSLVEAKKDGKTIIAGKAGVSFDTDKAREIIGDGSQETYTIPVTITQPSITAEMGSASSSSPVSSGVTCRRPSSNCRLLITSLSHDCPCALVSMRTSVSPI